MRISLSCAMAAVVLLGFIILPQAAKADDEHWSLNASDDLPSPEEAAANPAIKDVYARRLKWRNDVLHRLQERIVEPHGCDSGDPCSGDQNIILSFTVDADGRIVDQSLVRSSHSPARDTAALATLTHVSPLTAPPLFEGEDEVTLDFTIKRVATSNEP